MCNYFDKYLPDLPYTFENVEVTGGADWSFFFFTKLWTTFRPTFLRDIKGEWLTKMDARFENQYLSAFVTEWIRDLETTLLLELDERLSLETGLLIEINNQQNKVSLYQARWALGSDAESKKEFKTAFFHQYAVEDIERRSKLITASAIKDAVIPTKRGYYSYDRPTYTEREQSLVNVRERARWKAHPHISTTPQKLLKKLLLEPNDEEMFLFWDQFLKRYKTVGKAAFIAKFKSKYLTLFKKELVDGQLKKEVWHKYIWQNRSNNLKISFYIHCLPLHEIISFLFDDWF